MILYMLVGGITKGGRKLTPFLEFERITCHGCFADQVGFVGKSKCRANLDNIVAILRSWSIWLLLTDDWDIGSREVLFFEIIETLHSVGVESIKCFSIDDYSSSHLFKISMQV